jgi:hypothetical protein
MFAFQRKSISVVTRTLWRMDAARPAGGYVTQTDADRKSVTPAEQHERWCRASSFDLLNGACVSETGLDSLTADLVDEFTKAGR